MVKSLKKKKRKSVKKFVVDLRKTKYGWEAVFADKELNNIGCIGKTKKEAVTNAEIFIAERCNKKKINYRLKVIERIILGESR